MDQIQDIRDVLQGAVDNRGRQYAFCHTYSITFKNGDARASDDTSHFQTMLRLLGLPRAKEIILEEKTSLWDLHDEFGKLTNLLDQEDGRKLIIMHYAGVGLFKEGDFHLAASLTSNRTLHFDQGFGSLWTSNGDFDNSDVILILDCCYSRAMTRSMKQTDRSVEIVAAAGMTREACENPSNRIRVQNRTLTSRLSDEIGRAVSNNDRSSVAFSEIIADMRQTSITERLPEYSLRQGTIGIRLPLPESSRAMAQESSSSSDPQLTALFKIHLNVADSTSPEVVALIEWIQSLNPNTGLELNGVFQGRRRNSTHIILCAPWPLWAVFNGLEGFDLICESVGGNQMPRQILAQ